MALDRPRTDLQASGDGLVAVPARHELRDLPLARCQAGTVVGQVGAFGVAADPAVAPGP